MCGICGVVQVGGTPRRVLEPGVLDRMTDAMTHRGPNDRGTYEADGVALGIRRLSIVDVEGGHQPFANEDGAVWAIQNGELYNHAGIHDELARDGHVFTSRCDTEILPHLYERDGVRFPEALRGMFGLAVWDAHRRRTVLARDRLGIKPLYYAAVDDLVVFASELKSVLASGLVRGEVDVAAVDAYLALGYVPGPLSPIAGVRKLLPGHRLMIDPEGVREERWWQYPEPAQDDSLGIEESAEMLLAELDTSVRLRLMSDVPLGAMLSGGLDSSLIVAMMARHMDEPVKTFSVGFKESSATNELADARLVASTFGTDHYELELSLAEQSVELAELVWCLDEPLADLSSVGFYALSELAARHVTVALSGQGADELFGGYLKHRAASLCGPWDALPSPLRQGARRLAPHARGRFRRAARTLTAPDPATRLLAMSSKLDPEVRGRLARGPLAKLEADPALAAIRAALGGVTGRPLETTLFLDGQLALVDDMLHYFDRTSMAHSLEVRVPFLDHHLVEFAATVPGRHKVRRLTTKYVLKRAARGILPDRIIDKPKRGFFRQEVGDWFKAQARGAISDYLLDPGARYPELLDRRAVDSLVDDFLRGRETRNPHLLLAILMLEVWLSSFVPRALADEGAPRPRVVVPA